MNEFYSIAREQEDPLDNFQLRNLGSKTISAIIGKRVRGDYGESSRFQSQRFYRETTPEDYDRLFAKKITDYTPPYDLGELIEYHLRYYLSRHGDKQRFIRHLKFVVLPILKEKKNKQVYVGLVDEWIKAQTEVEHSKWTTNLELGDINAPTQILVNSENSNQSQEITYSSKDIVRLLETLSLDLENLEADVQEDLRHEISKAQAELKSNKDVRGRLLTIGGMIKDIGLNVFSNLISSPILESLKLLMGL